jgi:hypothetical protein
MIKATLKEYLGDQPTIYDEFEKLFDSNEALEIWLKKNNTHPTLSMRVVKIVTDVT